MQNSFTISWVYILNICYRFFNFFHFWQTVWCCQYNLGCWFFLAICGVLYPPVYFLSICLSVIIAITNSNGDSALPWKTPLWLVHFETICYPALRDPIICLFVVNPCQQAKYPFPLGSFVSSCSSSGCVDQRIFALLFLWSTCSILSVSPGTICGFAANRQFPP